MPMYWTGPWKCYCFCGWESDWKKNPVAAQFAGEAHRSQCSATRDAALILSGEKRFENVSNRDRYFQSARFLKATDVKNGQQAVVEKFEEVTTRIGLRPILRLKGMDLPLGLNATNYDAMTEKFGEDEAKWAGKKITLNLEIANNPQTGKNQKAIRIA